MQFGPLSVRDSQGAILAHSVRVRDQVFRKGRLLTPADIAALTDAGIAEIVVAKLDADDVREDIAAARLAALCAGAGIRAGAAFTGRANLYAESPGLICFDTPRIAALNAIDESITIATLPPFTRVDAEQMIATIKIIPFAVSRQTMQHAETLLDDPPIRVSPFSGHAAALISTVLPATRPQILDKNARAIETRLKALGSELVMERRVAHEVGAVASSIEEAASTDADPILVFGASAITDRRDVIPAAVEAANGTIVRFGMPVDPGNLLLLGTLRGKTIIGLPGCARSPKRNGFDFVLERVLAGVPVNGSDIALMGVGGLLGEIASRPQPRDAAPMGPHAPKIAAIVLAAGLATRMGHNKLTAEIGGKPLIRGIVEAVARSHVSKIVIVTGNDAADVLTALDGLPVVQAHNPDFREGLSTSLKTGIRAVGEAFDGAIVLLGDMPGVSTQIVDRLIAAFNSDEGRAICVATHRGKRGNPVLWARRFFPEILSLDGDIGAKHLITANEDSVCEVESEDDGPLVDVDTPAALESFRARFP